MIRWMIGWMLFVFGVNAFTQERPNGTPWQLPAKGEWTFVKPTPSEENDRSDLINIYFHGSLAQLDMLLQKAGWFKAAVKSTEGDILYGAAALDAILHPEKEKSSQGVQTMPVSTQYYLGQNRQVGDMQMAAYEKDNEVKKGRHHFRVFDTQTSDEKGRSVLAIAASRDIGIIVRKVLVPVDLPKPRTNIGKVISAGIWKGNSPYIEKYKLDHQVEANADLERNLVAKNIQDEAIRAGLKVYITDARVDVGPAAPRNGLYSADKRVITVEIE